MDQESFADQTLTYCILKELEDQQRVVTSPRERSKKDEDDFLKMEDNLVDDGRRPLVVDDQMSRSTANTNTSTDEADETGSRETILGKDGGVDTGFGIAHTLRMHT